MPRWGPKTRLLIPSTPDHVVRDSSPTLNPELYATTPVRERTPTEDHPPDPIHDPTATPAAEYAGPIHHDTTELVDMTQKRAPNLFITTPQGAASGAASPRSRRSGSSSPAKNGGATPTSPWSPRTPPTATADYPPTSARSLIPQPNPIREARKEWGRPEENNGPIHSPDSADSSQPEREDGKTSVHRYAKPVRRLPFRRPPAYEDSGWLHDSDRATQWLSAFYDLVVVAVLSVFSSTHKIAVPSAIGIFFS